MTLHDIVADTIPVAAKQLDIIRVVRAPSPRAHAQNYAFNSAGYRPLERAIAKAYKTLFALQTQKFCQRSFLSSLVNLERDDRLLLA